MDPDLSWVAGSTGSPLLEMTIGQAVDRAAVCWGDYDAIVSAAQEYGGAGATSRPRRTPWRPDFWR